MPERLGSISSQPAAAAATATDRIPADQEVGAIIQASAMVVGRGYRIVALGTGTNWAAAGAGASPVVGRIFDCSGSAGAGTGTAQQVTTRYVTAAQLAALAAGEGSPVFDGLTVTGTATLAHIHGSLAGRVYEHVRNVSGGTLPALTPYRVVGSQGDTDRVTIVAARADDPALMPASGILAEALENNADGHGVIAGVITGANTAGLVSGALRYVALAGGMTSTRPSANVQAVAMVGRVHANTGTLIVLPGSALSLAAFTGAYADLAGRPDLSVYATRKIYRSAFAFPFTYLGSAAPGTAESATGWTVRRIQETAAGAVTATLSATGAWVDYSSLSYS